MNRFLTLILVLFLTGLQALAQTDLSNSVSPTNRAGPSNPTGSSKARAAPPDNAGPAGPPARLPKLDMVAVRWHLHALNAALAKDPDDRDCRLKLVQVLESLAAHYEQGRDHLNAWRYYDNAAKVLDYAKDKSSRKRADDDAKKAAINRKLGVALMESHHDYGWVFTTFDWRKYKNVDRLVCADYMKQVGAPVRTNWGISKKLYQLHIPEGTSPRLVVSFNVRKNGMMSDIKLAKSCGSKSVDAFALQAVKDAGQVPQLLPAMGDVAAFEAQFVR